MMRPLAGSEAFQPRSRKSSLAEQPTAPSDPRSSSPVTFFLRRGSQGNETRTATEAKRERSDSPVQSLADTLSGLQDSTVTVVGKDDEEASSQSPRRRSTLKAKESDVSPFHSSDRCSTPSCQHEPLTPLLIPSYAGSLPSSPKSTSTRSLRPSEIDSAPGDGGSQAVLSSEDEENPAQQSLQLPEGAPQLIMPSIKIPSRRPFTGRGKVIGNFKILIAGSRGVGKTSLIKSIVQTCEDIVHVDHLSTSKSLSHSDLKGKRRNKSPGKPSVMEIHASTKPYPPWWSEFEDSKALSRRRSIGDTILERNICFVDTETQEGKSNTLEDYIEDQLRRSMRAAIAANSDLTALLSGSGGQQVDVVLYMITKATLSADVSKMKALSQLSTVIPLISKADLLSPEDVDALKAQTRIEFDIGTLPKPPTQGAPDLPSDLQATSAPYTVSSAISPDHDTMDASLLMSPDYVQPLMSSELGLLVQQLFEADTISYLRHSAARKLIAWRATAGSGIIQQLCLKPADPALSSLWTSSSGQSVDDSSLPSPLLPSSRRSFSPNPGHSPSGILVPFPSDISLDDDAVAAVPSSDSNSHQAMVRLAQSAQQEERLAQIRLTKWASDLQDSLQRERERFEKLARGERATWLVERIGEETRARGEGSKMALRELLETSRGIGNEAKLTKREDGCAASTCRSAGGGGGGGCVSYQNDGCSMNDPLGLFGRQRRGWIALQIVGSFGILGGFAFWLARGCGSAICEWVANHGWSWNGNGNGNGNAQ